jgi:hypothetical protein
LQLLPERFNRGSRRLPIIRRSFTPAQGLPHGLQAAQVGREAFNRAQARYQPR